MERIVTSALLAGKDYDANKGAPRDRVSVLQVRTEIREAAGQDQ